MATICYVCGSRGFSRGLIYCNGCHFSSVHQYCLTIYPASFEDYAAWVCDDCGPKQEPLTSGFIDNCVDNECKEARLTGTGDDGAPLKRLKKDLKKRVICGQPNSNEIEEDGTANKRLKENKKKRTRCRKASSSEMEEDDILIKRLTKDKKQRISEVREGSPSVEPSHMQPGKNHEKNSEFVRQNSFVSEDTVICDKGGLAVEATQCVRSGEFLDNKVEKGNEIENKRPVLDDRVNCTKEAKLVRAKLSHERGIENLPENRVKGQDSDKKDKADLGLGENICERELLATVRQSNGENTEKDPEVECVLVEQSAMEDRESCSKDSEPVDSSLNIMQQAYPLSEPIWKGRFSLCNERYGKFDGLAAYFSCFACARVQDEAKLLPDLLLLDLLPTSYVWPKGFQRSPPGDQNIALYFFPYSERSEKIYDGLVDDMVEQDLAMRAIGKNAELLIFTSTKLPLDFWRFKSKYYLWGVFRKKQAANVEMTVKIIDNDETKQ